MRRRFAGQWPSSYKTFHLSEKRKMGHPSSCLSWRQEVQFAERCCAAVERKFYFWLDYRAYLMEGRRREVYVVRADSSTPHSGNKEHTTFMAAITNLGSLRCPRCASPYVYLSRYPGLMERALRRLNMLPYRCGDCDKHYYFAESPRQAREVGPRTA